MRCEDLLKQHVARSTGERSEVSRPPSCAGAKVTFSERIAVAHVTCGFPVAQEVGENLVAALELVNLDVTALKTPEPHQTSVSALFIETSRGHSNSFKDGSDEESSWRVHRTAR